MDTLVGAHDGVIIASTDGRMHIEYLVDATAHVLKIYTLDKDGRPLPLSEPARVTLRGPEGPVEFTLADCGDPAYPAACGQASYSKQFNGPPAGIVRIEHGEHAYRLALPQVVRP